MQPLSLGGNGNELRDWINVRDVVRALDLIAMQASADVAIINVGTGVASSVRQVATNVAQCWPLPNAAEVLQFSGQSRPGDPFSLVANTTALKQLGFSCEIPIDQGLAEYVQWFQNN